MSMFLLISLAVQTHQAEGQTRHLSQCFYTTFLVLQIPQYAKHELQKNVLSETCEMRFSRR